MTRIVIDTDSINYQGQMLMQLSQCLLGVSQTLTDLGSAAPNYGGQFKPLVEWATLTSASSGQHSAQRADEHSSRLLDIAQRFAETDSAASSSIDLAAAGGGVGLAWLGLSGVSGWIGGLLAGILGLPIGGLNQLLGIGSVGARPGRYVSLPEGRLLEESSPGSNSVVSTSASAGGLSPFGLLLKQAEAEDEAKRQQDPYRGIAPVSQGEIGGKAACAITVISMITTYWHGKSEVNVSRSRDELYGDAKDKGADFFVDRHGIDIYEAAELLRDHGYEPNYHIVNQPLEELRAAVSEHPAYVPVAYNMAKSQIMPTANPGFVIKGVETYHAVLVTSVGTDDVVYFNDPWTGTSRSLPWADFDAGWAGYPGSVGDYYILEVRPATPPPAP